MRHGAEPEQMTRLLLQKPQAYAEVSDDDSRIMISGLAERGWTVERLEVEASIRITATRIPVQADTTARIAQADAALEASQLRFAALMQDIAAWKRKGSAEAWRMAAVACSAGAVVGTLFGRGWALVLAVAIFGVSVCIQIAGKVKGAKA